MTKPEYIIITSDGRLTGCYYEDGNNSKALFCSRCGLSRSSEYICSLVGKKWTLKTRSDVDYDEPKPKYQNETGTG